MTNREWIRLHCMLCDAQKAIKDLDDFQSVDSISDAETELDAYAECVSNLRVVVEKLEELVKEKEKVE